MLILGFSCARISFIRLLYSVPVYELSKGKYNVIPLVKLSLSSVKIKLCFS